MLKKIEKNNIIGLIRLYRFISILLTVFIYAVHGLSMQYDVTVMVFLIICVVLSNFILHYLYMISYHVKARIHLLLFMEILGISFLMLFTEA